MSFIGLATILFSLLLVFGFKHALTKDPELSHSQFFWTSAKLTTFRAFIFLLVFNVLSSNIKLLSHWTSQTLNPLHSLGEFGLMFLGSNLMIIFLCFLVGLPFCLLLGMLSSLLAYPVAHLKPSLAFSVVVGFSSLTIHTVLLLHQAGSLI